MGCYNRDTAEYRALQKEFKNNVLIDILIEKWQGNNDTERIPTTNEVTDYLNKSKTSFSLKKRNFKEAILANLSRKKIISKYYGDYYVNTTNKETQVGSYKILKNNCS
jgi:dihydropteroate synthase